MAPKTKKQITVSGHQVLPFAATVPPAMTEVLAENLRKEFLKSVNDGSVSVVLQKAYDHVEMMVPKTPAVRDAKQLKEMANSCADQIMLFSGTLSQLFLTSPAHVTLDASRTYRFEWV